MCDTCPVCLLVVSVAESRTEADSSVAVYLWPAGQPGTTSHDATAVRGRLVDLCCVCRLD